MPQSFPTILITGATSGIGQRAALALARQGAHLVLTARSQAKAEATLKMIEAAAPGTRVNVYYGDFASLASVAALGREIVAHHARIDVLINNAGIHAFTQRVTVDGYAEMVAVNYLAPWLLTNILRETLVRSAPSRIVTVASEASRRGAGFDPPRRDDAAGRRLGDVATGAGAARCRLDPGRHVQRPARCRD